MLNFSFFHSLFAFHKGFMHYVKSGIYGTALSARVFFIEVLMAGRPSKFKEEYIGLAYRLALLGLKDEDLAKVFDIDIVTLHRWKLKNDQFCNALKRGKNIADIEVVESLYKRAKGYDITESCNDKETTKHIPPDVTACIFWLKNRQPSAWRDKQDVNMSAKGINIVVADDKAKETVDGI